MSDIKALLFDMDGLIIDSEAEYDIVTAELFKSFGITYDRNELKPKMSGKSAVECMQFLAEHYDISVTGEQLNQLRKEKIEEAYRNKIPFIEGFLEFYHNLREKFDVPMAIVTGCTKEYFELIDKRLRLTKLFDSNVFMTDNPKLGLNSKPEPDIFVYAARQLGVNPEECAVFEDAPNGIVASLKAGVKKNVILTRTFTKEIISDQSRELGYELVDGQNVLFIDDYSQESLGRVLHYLRI